jgi:pSer/pThr/pTyr-binding forkhead associated (FHA) protein
MHARIFPDGQFFFIDDLGSTNGTFVNGRKIDGPTQLKVRDEVVFGDTTLRYEE